MQDIVQYRREQFPWIIKPTVTRFIVYIVNIRIRKI